MCWKNIIKRVLWTRVVAVDEEIKVKVIAILKSDTIIIIIIFFESSSFAFPVISLEIFPAGALDYDGAVSARNTLN